VKVAREIKLGILTVLTIFLVVWGMNYLKGRDIFSRQITFYAVYNDVSGLIQSNPVSLNGVNIGQVNRIGFLPDGSGRILIECIIDNVVPIPANSTSMLSGASLTGSREIILLLGDSPQTINSGDTLASSMQISLQEEVSQLVIPIRERAEELFAQVDSVMVVFQSIFNPQTRNNITSSFGSIQQTLENLERTTDTFDKESTRIANILANVESISQNLRNNNENLTNILTNFSEISDTLAAANIRQTMANAEQSVQNLNQVLDKINRGEGSLGLLVNDEKLYRNLDNSATQLELLLEDIRRNPGRYVRISVFGGSR
jgi:phospholipid/cholesterol/gamma-HCH transport system substrate-binding protein